MRDARKLVHRCVYLNILKATPTQDIRKQSVTFENFDLHIFLFVSIKKNFISLYVCRILILGAWNILYDWLKDAERDKHWSVIKELLELYLELPVTIDLLKLNHTPKLIRQLSKRSDLDAGISYFVFLILYIKRIFFVQN